MQQITDSITMILNKIDDFMYYPLLLVVLCVAALYFTFRTKFVQARHFKESIRIIMDKPADATGLSSFQALMVSTGRVSARETSSAYPLRFAWAAPAPFSGWQ